LWNTENIATLIAGAEGRGGQHISGASYRPNPPGVGPWPWSDSHPDPYQGGRGLCGPWEQKNMRKLCGHLKSNETSKFLTQNRNLKIWQGPFFGIEKGNKILFFIYKG